MILRCLALLAAAALAPVVANAAETRSPGATVSVDLKTNVLFIIMDDTDWSLMNTRHSPHSPLFDAETPALDKLSEEGASFEGGMLTEGLCSPTKAEFLSGLTSAQSGVFQNGVGLSLDHNQLFDELCGGASPIECGGFGKYGSQCTGAPAPWSSCGSSDQGTFGFDHWRGSTGNIMPDHGNFNSVIWDGISESSVNIKGTHHDLYIANEFDSWVSGLAPGVRWAAWVHFKEMHAALHSPLFPNPGGDPDYFDGCYAPTDLDCTQDQLEHLDARIAQVIAAIPDPENTWVIVVGDDGQSLGGGFTYQYSNSGKGAASVLGTRVPVFIKGPGVHRGVIGGQMAAIDIFPTILSIMGVPLPATNNLAQPVDWKGVDLTPYLLTGTPIPDNVREFYSIRYWRQVPGSAEIVSSFGNHFEDWHGSYNGVASANDSDDMLVTHLPDDTVAATGEEAAYLSQLFLTQAKRQEGLMAGLCDRSTAIVCEDFDWAPTIHPADCADETEIDSFTGTAECHRTAAPAPIEGTGSAWKAAADTITFDIGTAVDNVIGAGCDAEGICRAEVYWTVQSSSAPARQVLFYLGDKSVASDLLCGVSRSGNGNDVSIVSPADYVGSVNVGAAPTGTGRRTLVEFDGRAASCRVAMWDTNGTPSNEADDILLGNQTISDVVIATSSLTNGLDGFVFPASSNTVLSIDNLQISYDPPGGDPPGHFDVFRDGLGKAHAQNFERQRTGETGLCSELGAVGTGTAKDTDCSGPGIDGEYGYLPRVNGGHVFPITCPTASSWCRVDMVISVDALAGASDQTGILGFYNTPTASGGTPEFSLDITSDVWSLSRNRAPAARASTGVRPKAQPHKLRFELKPSTGEAVVWIDGIHGGFGRGALAEAYVDGIAVTGTIQSVKLSAGTRVGNVIRYDNLTDREMHAQGPPWW